MRIGIIGLGRVGTALACALSHRGNQVFVCSRKAEGTDCLELAGRSFRALSLQQLPGKTELLFITTPDRVIPEMARCLRKAGLKDQPVLHMSGSLSSEVLMPLREAGCRIGSLHPLQSFASVQEAVDSLPGSCFTYEGDPELHNLLYTLVTDLGGSFHILPSPESKTVYHAGACLASNYLVLLVDLAVQCLEQAGFDRAKGQEVLVPLMQGTLRNLAALPLEQALTGPLARGDLGVISTHLAGLRDRLPEVVRAYRELTPLLGQLAVRGKRLEPEKYSQLINILHGG